MDAQDSSFFDLGDNTALVCVDHQQYQKLVVPQLIDMTYKVHLGLFEEDVLLKLKTYSYNVIIVSDRGIDRVYEVVQSVARPPANVTGKRNARSTAKRSCTELMRTWQQQ